MANIDFTQTVLKCATQDIADGIAAGMDDAGVRYQRRKSGHWHLVVVWGDVADRIAWALKGSYPSTTYEKIAWVPGGEDYLGLRN